jgi:hypothetical protein
MAYLMMIVEGDGDVQAAPILARRILHSQQIFNVDVPKPIRIRRDQFLRKPDLREKYLLLARAKAGNQGRVLVLLDADDECPRDLVVAHLAQMQHIVSPTTLSLVFAKTEFEAWFIAAADSLAGKHGLPVGLVAPPNAETIPGAKGWLRHQMPSGQGYSETVDQPALTALFDWELGRGRSPSLDKFCREVLEPISNSLEEHRDTG